MFYVYILRSKKDGSFYIGQTNNIEDRVNRHNSGRSVYTKLKIPWDLVYYERFETRKGALQREKELKSWKSKIILQELVEHPD